MYCCILAWGFAISQLIASSPPYNKHEWTYFIKYYGIPWLICIICLIIFRTRPWRQLWGVFLSVLLIGRGLTVPIFLLLCFVGVVWLLHSSRKTHVFRMANLDIAFGVMAWLCAFLAMLPDTTILPWKSLDYLLTYGPLFWAICLLGVLVFRKHPWQELWWAFPSAIFVFGLWEMMTIAVMMGLRLN